MLQKANPLRKSAPGPPNISDEHISCTAKCIFADPLQMSGARQRMKPLQNLHLLLTFDKVHNPVRLPRKTTSEHRTVLRTCGVFNILTWKCASRHNGVHFFDISTTKSGPTMVCFVHFDFEMRFAPQRRAIFHLSSPQMAPH